MVKPEWGTKRGCPKCGTRFYDLGKDDPVVCIECSNQWTPEPILKSKQPLPFEAAKPEKEAVKKDSDLGDDDLDVDEDEEPSTTTMSIWAGTMIWASTHPTTKTTTTDLIWKYGKRRESPLAKPARPD